ncbi:MAG: DUF5522 domain-containing protein, partial [Cytophagales bacterium]
MKTKVKSNAHEQQDYYMENGLMVFTEHFHL